MNDAVEERDVEMVGLEFAATDLDVQIADARKNHEQEENVRRVSV